MKPRLTAARSDAAPKGQQVLIPLGCPGLGLESAVLLATSHHPPTLPDACAAAVQIEPGSISKKAGLHFQIERGSIFFEPGFISN